MDKLKQRAKRKRRREREAAVAAENKRLADAFNNHYKELGMRHNFTPNQVRRAYDQVERQSITTAIMADTIATLWVMRKEYGYGNRRLCRLATEITQRVNWVGNAERSLRHLEEELKYDAKLDCAAYWTGTSNIDTAVSRSERQRREAVLRSAPVVFPIHMHAVFYELFKNPIARESAKLDRIAQLASSAAKRAIEQDRLKEYIADLSKCGFKIDMQGRFGGRDVTPEEYQRFTKLLAV